MKSKRFFVLILVLVLVFTITACRKNPADSYSSVSSQTGSNRYSDSMALLYSAGDTFNPYTLKTDINRQLCMLLYEPLVKLSNEFEPIYSLAESVTTEGTRCTVRLKSAVFSDGSSVTADDVVYSCNLARNSGNSYSAKLYEVKSVTAADSKTVEFTLTKADPYFQNLLDFPIIKSGSDNVTDSDSVYLPPIGCGRYTVSEDKQSLVINPKYSGKQGSIKKIELINAPDSESVSHYAQIGAADMYYSDISDGNILRISGKKLNVNLNNLVYIGINQNYGALKENAVRQAISTGIARSKLCQDSYYNNAIAATGFFNPVWAAAKSVQNIQINANKEITIENLEKIGYNSLDSRGLRKNSAGDYLSFTMLVNSENRIRVAAAQNIASQLLEYGIKITVVEKSYADYLTALTDGDFQLFLGEVKLTGNMDISCLVTEGGSAAYGIKKAEENRDGENTENSTEENSETDLSALGADKVVEGLYSGQNTIADVASVLQTEMPFVPVCYRTGVLFCNEAIENIDSFCEGDIYLSIDSYIINQ